MWRSRVGLEVGGPIAFGYVFNGFVGLIALVSELFYSLQHTFVPIGEYREPRSVIEEYGTVIT